MIPPIVKNMIVFAWPCYNIYQLHSYYSSPDPDLHRLPPSPHSAAVKMSASRFLRAENAPNSEAILRNLTVVSSPPNEGSRMVSVHGYSRKYGFAVAPYLKQNEIPHMVMTQMAYVIRDDHFWVNSLRVATLFGSAVLSRFVLQLSVIPSLGSMELLSMATSAVAWKSVQRRAIDLANKHCTQEELEASIGFSQFEKVLRELGIRQLSSLDWIYSISTEEKIQRVHKEIHQRGGFPKTDAVDRNALLQRAESYRNSLFTPPRIKHGSKPRKSSDRWD